MELNKNFCNNYKKLNWEYCNKIYIWDLACYYFVFYYYKNISTIFYITKSFPIAAHLENLFMSDSSQKIIIKK